MNKFINFMERYFVPFAIKISTQRHLVVIRDSFIDILPITMVGSIAVLLNVFFRDLPRNYGYPEFADAMTPLININGIVWFGSIAILSLVFVFALGYNLANSYKTNAIAGGLVAFASFIMFLPQSANFTTTIDGTAHNISEWGYLAVNYLGAKGIFPAMVIGFFSTIIYSKLMLRNITIKLPDSVPPSVSKAFSAIIPGTIAIYASAIVSYGVTQYTGQSLHDVINTYIAMPLLGLSQGLFSVLVLAFLTQLFWFFGLHGHNVLAPIFDGIYQPALLANVEHMALGGTVDTLPYLWTRGSFDAYLQMGGSGITIGLIISILLFSKREDSRTVVKLGIPMGVFNINEPIIFGMPIVLNPLYVIPFILAPMAAAIIGYTATVMGIVPPVFVQVPWVLPPGIFAFFATGGSFAAALVSLFNVFVAFIIWTPFVLIANKIKSE
ncbi:PTS sugar transporter subunit IIC [Phocoenobacter skyensis]|uniref:Permease IIC component n=1 Tax=Phocoenobacter skyensis TaxID=97481 RepID=A0A1H7VAH0_9PAST|nr:PTS sugar transporter subunit IIC [Pasteurella skyensis]MDP8078380.1 PTS sugar transporter subunit IIC [Pasteurella skyensis]MDP8084528.1 PTS sugar transporter subunit IIC [Pasteurella skyensis]MDP8174385.1 PTS sugar transporter subunit IIC [Pasteurella skyensis]MDP8184347.1 PTS sugar transporter subunit IIC [Pasteurella skyensis]QLB23368.1 PTS cellobiose transporter subunit IIC [Pasteurella skyensis]